MASLGVIAIVLMSILAQNISEDGFKRVTDVFDDSKKVQNIQQDFIAPLFRVREITLSLVMAPNDDYREEIRVGLLPIIEKLDRSFNSLDIVINKIWKNYKRLVFLTDEYIKNGFEEGAFTNANNAERKQFYILIAKLEKLQEKQLKNSYETFEKAEASFLAKKSLIISGALVVVILTLLFGFVIARNIVFSIESVQKGLGRFFDLLGRKIDKDKKIGIELDNIDEFGEMAKIINNNVEIVRENLKKDIKLIEDATSVVNSLKKGDLEQRLEEDASSDELNRLKQVMNEMLNNLEDRIVLEINERTKQEQLLIQQSKLASMGNMIGNIAHQWRQPLSEINAILMNMQVKKEHNDLSDAFFEESIEECDVILSHMSNTISDFQNFFKPSKEKTKFSLQEECKNASFIIESSLKYNNIKFEIDIDKDCEVLGYPREFSQAILNILSNAKDVLIEREIKNPYIKLSLKKGNKFALIKIQDNGGGVSDKVKDRLFEPYFTTKHAKQGTGIGLYMSKIIIEVNMHGFINVENSEYGAIFTIKLAL
jgi:signal transduction histidine kinase